MFNIFFNTKKIAQDLSPFLLRQTLNLKIKQGRQFFCCMFANHVAPSLSMELRSFVLRRIQVAIPRDRREWRILDFYLPHRGPRTQNLVWALHHEARTKITHKNVSNIVIFSVPDDWFPFGYLLPFWRVAVGVIILINTINFNQNDKPEWKNIQNNRLEKTKNILGH